MFISGLDECMVIGDIAVIYCIRQVLFRKQFVTLSDHEYALLCLLIAHRGMALSKRQISLGVWGNEERIDRVPHIIRALRKRLDPNRQYILTDTRKGYRMAVSKYKEE